MTDRERFWNVMEYKPVDRGIYGIGMGIWSETIERWKSEGYEPSKEPLFQTDHWERIWDWFFPNPPFERKVISEDDRTILYINSEGSLVRELRDSPSSMPQFIRFPVETREDFRKFMKERMRPDLAGRIGKDYAQKLQSYKNRSFPLIITSDHWGGFFGPLRSLVGVEKICMLFYDDPAFVEEMMEAIADFIIAMMDQILNYTDIDMYGFWEDMAYKTGPLISPQLVKRYMFPRYRRVIDFLNSRGVKWISLDSDGNINSLIPIWLDAGINFIYPFEVQSGMDVVKVRKTFGKELRIWGGIDKRAIAEGPSAIDNELKRVSSLVREGGYVPAPDHSLPPDVSFSNYCYFMGKLKALVEEKDEPDREETLWKIMSY